MIENISYNLPSTDAIKKEVDILSSILQSTPYNLPSTDLIKQGLNVRNFEQGANLLKDVVTYQHPLVNAAFNSLQKPNTINSQLVPDVSRLSAITNVKTQQLASDDANLRYQGALDNALNQLGSFMGLYNKAQLSPEQWNQMSEKELGRAKDLMTFQQPLLERASQIASNQAMRQDRLNRNFDLAEENTRGNFGLKEAKMQALDNQNQREWETFNNLSDIASGLYSGGASGYQSMVGRLGNTFKF